MTTAAPGRAHLCLVQPRGYLHSLALLDPLLYLRDRLGELGVDVSVGKNRLVHGAVNYVFGAHLGFDARWLDQWRCVLVNLEKLTPGSIFHSEAYVDLLRRADVVDYHEGNTLAYQQAGKDAPVLTLGVDRTLARQRSTTPLRDRPVDVLFLGSVGGRRLQVLQSLEAAGRSVAVPTAPAYGRERNALITQAKVVLNVNADDSGIFEQVRASLVLSLGTPLVSERTPLTAAQQAVFGSTVEWVDLDDLGRWFAREFLSPAQLTSAQAQVDAFHAQEQLDDVAAMWAQHIAAPGPTARPTPDRLRIDLGSGSYTPGWLNIATAASSLPDILLSSAGAVAGLPRRVPSERWGEVVLDLNRFRHVHITGLDSAGGDVAAALRGASRLLALDGSMVLDWPAALPLDALDHLIQLSTREPDLGGQLSVARADGCDPNGRPVPPGDAHAVRVILTKSPHPTGRPTSALASHEDLEAVIADCLAA